MPISRRRFTALVPAVAALAALKSGIMYGSSRKRDDQSTTLVSYLPRSTSACTLGGIYLRDNPQEADMLLLEKQILNNSSLRQDFHAATGNSQHAMLKSLVRRDYKSGKTVMLAGWVLSQTEARLFAMTRLKYPE